MDSITNVLGRTYLKSFSSKKQQPFKYDSKKRDSYTLRIEDRKIPIKKIFGKETNDGYFISEITDEKLEDSPVVGIKNDGLDNTSMYFIENKSFLDENFIQTGGSFNQFLKTKGLDYNDLYEIDGVDQHDASKLHAAKYELKNNDRYCLANCIAQVEGAQVGFCSALIGFYSVKCLSDFAHNEFEKLYEGSPPNSHSIFMYIALGSAFQSLYIMFSPLLIKMVSDCLSQGGSDVQENPNAFHQSAGSQPTGLLEGKSKLECLGELAIMPVRYATAFGVLLGCSQKIGCMEGFIVNNLLLNADSPDMSLFKKILIFGLIIFFDYSSMGSSASSFLGKKIGPAQSFLGYVSCFAFTTFYASRHFQHVYNGKNFHYLDYDFKNGYQSFVNRKVTELIKTTHTKNS